MLVSKSRRPHEEEKKEKYDPVNELKAALAGAGTSGEARLGGYAISVYWVKQALEALGTHTADNS